jgi:predicted metal-binding membrane protein
VLVSLLAWLYVIREASSMKSANTMDMNMHMEMNMDMGMDMAMPQMHTWTGIDLVLIFTMWTVMMIAMMVPTAGPMILLFATFNRKRREQKRPFVRTGIFLLGYLIVWTGFSVIAALAQWGLHRAALLSPMMVSTSSALGGSLLVAAGVFQWTPLKNSCLAHCRSPLDFFSGDWREGNKGALIMGLKHGAYCLGCCWVLMLLLFVTGVMNLIWIAAIAVFVLVEKVAPARLRAYISGGAGLVLAGWGLFMLLSRFHGS